MGSKAKSEQKTSLILRVRGLDHLLERLEQEIALIPQEQHHSVLWGRSAELEKESLSSMQRHGLLERDESRKVPSAQSRPFPMLQFLENSDEDRDSSSVSPEGSSLGIRIAMVSDPSLGNPTNLALQYYGNPIHFTPKCLECIFWRIDPDLPVTMKCERVNQTSTEDAGWAIVLGISSSSWCSCLELINLGCCSALSLHSPGALLD